MPPGVTDRDLLQYMWIKKDESSNTTFVIFKDATHPKISKRKDFVRYRLTITVNAYFGLIVISHNHALFFFPMYVEQELFSLV